VKHVAVRLLALIITLSTAGLVVSMPAAAAPRPIAAPGNYGDDGEGGSKTLLDQLEAASRGFLEAQEALAHSENRQRDLTTLLKQINAELGPRQATLDHIAAQTYRTGRLGAMSALLTASSSGTLLDRTQTLQTMAVQQNDALRSLRSARTRQAQAKVAIDAAVRDQRKQLNTMAKRKAQAENALKAANAGEDARSPSDGGGSARATAVPRNPDGSLPSEGCTVNDPTTSGCITPRLLHALQQAKSAGFTHFVSCYRSGGSGEHPKGRACDFAADKNGFGGVATGSSKDYGNRLANYFINNSSRLAVLYVIWFRRIWLPSSGWKSYTRGNGDPSSDHTNHVHLSVR
jgi:peptidoglycan DL-endopeptidase CwlO